MAVFVFILAIIAFLLMEHPVAFWLVFVPLIIVFIFAAGKFLTSKRGHIGNLLMLMMVFVTMIVALVIVATPKPCEHESATFYSFTSMDSTGQSRVNERCKKCNVRLTYDSSFKGTPIDQSYLSAIKENSDGDEIIPGEYYTVTATVPSGFTAYGSDSVRLYCKVENADFVIGFTAEFMEEFSEQVRSVGKGDEITFRGRFYDEGCGFTDCEWIEEKP